MEYPRETELANFFVNEKGNLDCTLNIDFKTFDVSHESYFNGDDECTEEEYELVYRKVIKACNENGEYTIDCYKGRYTARLKSELESVRWNDMTEEQRAAVEAQKQEHERLTRIAELKNKLLETDYVVIKIAEGEATADEYAEVIANRKAWRKEINELEAQ